LATNVEEVESGVTTRTLREDSIGVLGVEFERFVFEDERVDHVSEFWR
jgi:hypothetical protein